MSARMNRQSPLLPILLPLSILIVIGLVLYGFSRILLQVTPTAATVVALIAAGTVIGAAAFVATRNHVSAASMFSLVGVVGGVAMLAGGLAVVAFPLHEAGPEAQPATLTAGPTASVDGFSTDALKVGSDVPIDLTFDNKESGVQHNVVIFDGDDDKAPQLFSGTLITGVDSTTYKVPALPEGTYFFHCQVHPSTMVGEITAAPGAGGGGGGGGPTVVAQNLTFDTAEIDLPDQPTTLHFVNQDAGTVHNIAIYTDDSASQALFDGADTTGPESVDYQVPALDPGEYYFRCDTHPTMNGKVVVSGGGGPGGAEGGGPGGGDQGGGGGGDGG